MEKIRQKELQERVMQILYRILPFFAIFCLIGLWILASHSSNSSFPGPEAVMQRWIKFQAKPIMKLSLWQHVGISLLRVFTALLFAWGIGIPLGILLGWNRTCRALFGSLFTAFRAVPPLAWIPLVTIWFGIGEIPKVLIVFIGALMPVVVNTQAGMSNVNPLYLNVGDIFNANDRQKLFEIAIPSALDAIFAGIRTSTSAGWTVVLAAEMLGGKSGVGFLITRGMESGDLPLVLLSMICIGLSGVLLAITTQMIERWLCPWTR